MYLPIIRKISLCALLTLAIVQADCARYSRKALLTQKLVGVNLSGYDFYNLKLQGVNLTRARLHRTNFSFAVLTSATMVNADLRGADLSAADLSGADLRGANFRNARMHNAVLRRANLIDAYFYGADLSGSDLREAVMIKDAAGASGGSHTRESAIARKDFFVHLRDADMAGAAVSVKMKDFIALQKVKNFDKIIWSK